MEIIELDVGMDSNLIAETRELAMRYFGDDSEVSMAQVLELAFKMRSLWFRSIKQGQQETGEAVSTWEFPESIPGQKNDDSIQKWLFRR